MDQPSALNLAMDSSAVPTPSEGMSSPDPTAPASTTSPSAEVDTDAASRQHPIPPASEPMQYRAIGLVRGVYTPSEDQFTRGNLVTDDGVTIDSVLLGRVMSLVRKHLDLEQPHLWVVYPRTREKQYDLHVQIVGVWEPEKLAKTDADGDESASADEAEAVTPGDDAEATDAAPPEASADAEAELPEETEHAAADQTTVTTTEQEEAIAPNRPIRPQPPTPPAKEADPQPISKELTLDDGYFSVRGEILFCSPEDERLIVRIQQASKKAGQPPKSFKLILKGTLEGKTVGYFWDLQVRREGNLLAVQDSTMIGLVPPRKRSKKDNKRGPGGPKNFRKSPRRSDHSHSHGSRGERPIKRSSRPTSETKSDE